MSNGIEVMKEKIKKKMKMTLDDLPSPKQDSKITEENFAVHTAVQPDVQTYSNTAVQQSSNAVMQQADKSKAHRLSKASEQSSVENIAVHTAIQPDVQMYSNTAVQQNSNTATQHNNEYTTIRKDMTSSEQSNTETQQYSKTVIQNGELEEDKNLVHNGRQQNSNTAIQQPGNTVIHQNENVFTGAQQDIQQNSNTGLQYDNRGFNNLAIEKNKTLYGRKMTLYLTEEMYKAFNDIYAKRMIEGRKTEKSALICEAVGLLHRNENM